MKRIVRLTENDLARIVRRVIRETQEKKMEEGFLSNFFGRKDKTKNSSVDSVDRSLIDIDGVKYKKVFRVLGFYPNEIRYYRDEDDNKIALVGNNYQAKAHSGTFDDMEEAREHMNDIGALAG